jgi:uncharacterized protein YbjQ (UPF0145 family)
MADVKEAGLVRATTIILEATRQVASELPGSFQAQVLGELEALEVTLDEVRQAPNRRALAALAHEVERLGADVIRLKREMDRSGH